MQKSQNKLARRLPLSLLVLYGVGTILGAGIYALAGKVAGESGVYTPYAFLMAALVVSFSAHAYAQLSRRYPKAAGEAMYVNQVLRLPKLAQIIGFGIVLTGTVSSATLARAFAAYLAEYLAVPEFIIILMFLCILLLISVWGVKEAVSAASVFTIIEVIGVVIVIVVAMPSMPSYVINTPALHSLPPASVLTGIAAGAFLAFYAFIGFEDIVNMAEEVKQPERNVPIAVYLSLIVTSVLYVLTALAFMTLLPLDTFTDSDAPFQLVAEAHPWIPVSLMTFISIAAISNGALIQVIMGSRVLYGMADTGLAPRVLRKVSKKTHTPVNATLLMVGMIGMFALLLPITTLAKMTSSVVLLIFTVVNLCLLVQEWRERSSKPFLSNTIDLLMPSIGMLLCIGFLALQFIPI